MDSIEEKSGKEFWMLMLEDTKNSACISEEELTRLIKEHLPDLDKIMDNTPEAGNIVQHQDAFAADNQITEFLLLGMAIKYMGRSGKTIHIIGKNGDTLKPVID